MTPESNSLVPVPRRRRIRNRAKVLTQPLPLTPINWTNVAQIYAPATPQQVIPDTADLLSCLLRKAVLTFISFGMEEFIKDLRTPQRGETTLDRLGKELFIAFFLEPGRHALAEARAGAC